MKKIVLIIAVFVLVLLLTKLANQAPKEQMSGIAFSLKAQKVIQCTPDEITLVDAREQSTHLLKDQSWPACTVYKRGQYLDFYLSRGERTHYINSEPTTWWRKTF